MAEVLFIGTGDAFGSGGRRNSAILVRGKQRTILLDCGATTLLGLKELGVDPLEIDAVAISHFHGDHAAGLPFLMLDYLYAHERDRPLDVLGPPGVEDRIHRLNQSFSYDGNGQDRYAVHYQEYTIGKSLEIEGFKVTPYPAAHHPDTVPHMLRVELDNRSVFFSGDTGWFDAIPNNVGPVDLFISECTLFEEGFEFHLSHSRLKKERERFECKRTIITHLGAEMLSNTDRIEFDTAHDGSKLEL